MPNNAGSYSAAGVYTGEIDNTIRATATPTSIGACVGPANRGAVRTPTIVIDADERARKFGKRELAVSPVHHCADAFLQESNRMYFYRIANEARYGGCRFFTNNTLCYGVAFGGGVLEPEDLNFGPSDILILHAANPGNWNNSLRVITYPDTNDVTGEGFVLEVFEGMSSIPVESYRATLFDKLDGNGKQLVLDLQLEESDSRIRAIINHDHPVWEQENANPMNTVLEVNIYGGTDGLAITEDDYIEAWEAFADPEDTEVNILINAGMTQTSIQHTMLEVAQAQENCFAILDVPRNVLQPQAAVNWRRETLAVNTSYGACYAPYLVVRDTDMGRDIELPPSGHVAAVYARTDRDAASWFAPAGVNRGQLDVLGLVETYKLGHRNMFAENQINPIVNLPGHGFVVYGADTLQTFASDLSNINVRRLISLIRTSVGRASWAGVYEPNDPFLWSELRNLAEDILAPIKRGRGLRRYEIVCDERNNTPDIQANGDCMLDVYLWATLPAKRIHINAILPKTGGIEIQQVSYYNDAA